LCSARKPRTLKICDDKRHRSTTIQRSSAHLLAARRLAPKIDEAAARGSADLASGCHTSKRFGLGRMIHHGVEARRADRRERLAARLKRNEERRGSYATSEHRHVRPMVPTRCGAAADDMVKNPG
jgi:hypothetical protein